MTHTTEQERTGRYTKKPVTIEAVQYGRRFDWPDWFHDAVSTNKIVVHGTGKHADPRAECFATIYTLEGVMTASEGDWIIQGVKGELYPCKPDVFSATYGAEQAVPRAPAVSETIEQRTKKLKGLQVLIGATAGVPEAIELARSRFTEAYGRSPLYDDLAYACLLIDAYGGAPTAPVPQWDGKINPADFNVETFRRSGNGWLVKPDNCVRITHVPTGLFEEGVSEWSIHTNKAEAWERLSARLEAAAAPQPPEAAPEHQCIDCEDSGVNTKNGYDCAYCFGEMKASAQIFTKDELKVPEGYALVSKDALRAWGKLDHVASMCAFPVSPGNQNEND